MLSLDLDTLVRVLIALEVADPTVGQVEQALRHKLLMPEWTEADSGALVVLLSEGEHAGALEVWTAPDYPSKVTLTPLSAERHALTLYQPFDEERLYWRLARDPENVPEADATDDPEMVDLALVIDPNAPTPFDALASAETVESYLKSLVDDDGSPPRDRGAIPARHLAGLRRGWPLPEHRVPDIQAGLCPGCLDKPQRLNEVCLWCHRSGIDRYLPAVKAEKTRKKYRTGRLKGGVGA